MSTDLRTLSKVLKHFHEELQTCMNHQDKGGPFHHNDPIFLGDFIVDAYNNYLDAARNATDHALIHALGRIEPLDEATLEGISIDSDLVGRDPRLQKMHEVAMATKQLLMVIEGAIQNGHGDVHSEMDGVIALLQSLGTQLDELNHDNRRSSRDWPEILGTTLEPLLAKYNDLLSVAIESTGDAVLEKLFKPISPDETDNPDKTLSELRLAGKGLKEYLHKRYVEPRHLS